MYGRNSFFCGYMIMGISDTVSIPGETELASYEAVMVDQIHAHIQEIFDHLSSAGFHAIATSSHELSVSIKLKDCLHPLCVICMKVRGANVAVYMKDVACLDRFNFRENVVEQRMRCVVYEAGGVTGVLSSTSAPHDIITFHRRSLLPDADSS